MAYPSVSLTKQFAGTSGTSDGIIDMLIADAVDVVESYTNRNFSGEAKTATETYDPANRIHFYKGDVTAVNSVKSVKDGVEADITDYTLDTHGNLLEINDYNAGADYIVVEYDYDYGSTPKPVSVFILDYVKQGLSGDRQVVSERTSNYQVTYDKSSSARRNVDVRRLVNYKYRRQRWR